MAARKPATADEIATALRGHEKIAAGHALEWRHAVDHLRWQLRTTPINARDWLTLATQDESHPFELVGTSYGKVYYVARGPESQTLSEAGYVDTDSDFWPYLSPTGAPVNGQEEGMGTRREFVILTSALQDMCKRALEFVTLERRTVQTVRAKSREAVAQKHGPSLAYIRGLLKMADAGADQVDTATHNFDRQQTALSLIFIDAAIDRLGEVLAAHGIEPDPPERIVTRKPTAPAVEGGDTQPIPEDCLIKTPHAPHTWGHHNQYQCDVGEPTANEGNEQ